MITHFAGAAGIYEAAAGWAESVEDRIANKVHELHAKVSE
jgi:hypothetical protein